MSDPNSTDSPNAARDKLIESIYRIALEPQTYDSFMGHWDSYISERIGDLIELQNAEDTQIETERYPEIASHFDIASRLLEQMDVKTAGETDTASGTSAEPQMLINQTGRIVWSNAPATRAFDLPKSASIPDLGLVQTQADALTEMAKNLHDAQFQHDPIILKMISKETKRPHYLYARILPEQHGDDVILISKVTPDWPSDTDRLLTEAFALSPSELEICAMIADGQGAAQITQRRKSALATVRTQIKNIMSKTSCSTQAELVRLLHSVMRIAEQSGKSHTLPSHAPERTLYVNLPGRVMPVEQFGDPAGQPVIFFHGMLDGNTTTHEFQALLRKSKLRLVCPVRPWFGNASSSNCTVAQAPDAFAQDVWEMMQQLDLHQPVLLGHMAGAVYAFATAAHAPPDAIKGVLSISGGVPITSSSQIAAMSKRQRLVAYTARFTPRILPFVIKAGISQMESGGEKKFMRSLYETSPHDLSIVSDPEISAIILAGYRFTVQQGHKAFETDSYHVVRNWSQFVDASSAPIKVIHGESDPVVSADSVAAFYTSRSNRAQVQVVEDCGQLVMYQHPDIVIQAIEDLLSLKAG